MNKTKIFAIKNKKTIKRAATLLLIVFLSFMIVSMTATAIIVRYIFGNMAAPDFTMRYTYSHFESAYPRRALDFKSGENILRGYYYGEENASKRLLVVVNGVACNSEGHLNEIIYFVDRGWRVFTYDATGIGESEGGSTVGLTQARRDLSACLNSLKPTEKDIYIYAHSVGAYATATLLPYADIKAAVLISGFDDPVDAMADNSKRYAPGWLVEIEKPFLRLDNLIRFGKEGSLSAVEAINNSDTPIEVFQGSKDDRVPYASSIYGRRDLIKNKNVGFYLTRPGHSSAWLTDSAAEYVAWLDLRYDELKSKYKGGIPENVIDGFSARIDYEKANELDTGFLSGIAAFFDSIE